MFVTKYGKEYWKNKVKIISAKLQKVERPRGEVGHRKLKTVRTTWRQGTWVHARYGELSTC